MRWGLTGALLLGGLGVVAASELADALGPRRMMRRALFRAAIERAKATNKPLLVVGDPDAGLVTRHIGRDYGCGVECTDLIGCGSCERSLEGDLVEVLENFNDNARVIFVSCVLEYVPSLEDAERELGRVSGGDLFVAHVGAWSPAAWVYPGARRRIHKAPPHSARIEATELPWSKNPGVAL